VKLGETSDVICTFGTDSLQVYGSAGRRDSKESEGNCYGDCRRRGYMGVMVIHARR